MSESNNPNQKNPFFPEDQKKQIISDFRDTAILIVMALLSSLLSLGKIVKTEDYDLLHTRNGLRIGNGVILYNTVPDAYTIVPIFILFGLLLFFFFFFRYRQTKVLPKRYVVLVLLVIFVIRFIGIFAFAPSGNYLFESPANGISVDVFYEGLSIGGKTVECFAELFYGLMFLLFFTYIKTFSKVVYPIYKVAIHVPLIIAMVLLLYSWIKEGDLWINNILFFFRKRPYPTFDIRSLAKHRNMFGFFLFLGTMTLIYDFFKSDDFLLIGPIAISVFCSLIILSKTCTIMQASFVFCSILLYVITNYKTRRRNAVYGIFLCLFIIVLSSLTITLLFHSGFIEMYRQNDTMHARIWLARFAMSMFPNQSPAYLIFGYGRIPFTQMFITYSGIANAEVIWATHNCYIDTLCHYGIIGLLFVAFIDGIVLYEIYTLVIKGKHRECIFYLPQFLILCIYSIFEPRMMFLLSSGTEVFLFYFVLLFPLLLDSGYSKNGQLMI